MYKQKEKQRIRIRAKNFRQIYPSELKAYFYAMMLYLVIN